MKLLTAGKKVFIQCSLLLLVASCAYSEIADIAATSSELKISFSSVGDGIYQIIEIPSYADCDPNLDYPIIWEGAPINPVTLDRFETGNDRLYSKFLLIDAQSRQPAGSCRYVTKIEYSEPLFDTHGWYNAFWGTVGDFTDGYFRITFFPTMEKPFDPIVINPMLIETNLQDKYLSLRLKLKSLSTPGPVPFGVYLYTWDENAAISDIFNVPGDGEFHIVSYDLSQIGGIGWADKRKLRLDPAEGEHLNFNRYENSEVVIDWIAVTDKADFDGTNPDATDIVWDFSDPANRNFTFPVPNGIKGVTCPMSVSDANQTNTKYITSNLTFNELLEVPQEGSYILWEMEGHKIPINSQYITYLDREVKPYTDIGAALYYVSNNKVPKYDTGSILIHPMTDLAQAPNGLGAFNLTSQNAQRHFLSAMQFLAHRYSHPDAPAGWIRGHIVGNEINSHWWWYNMGLATMEEVAEEYSRTVRLFDLAVKSVSPGTDTFISLEHNWTSPVVDEPLKCTGSRPMLEAVSENINAHGDIDWNLAFHPYPQNLYEPRFWLYDDKAQMSFDTPKLTMKNLELLPLYMSQKRFLHKGNMCDIIFSEQGFNTLDIPDGQQIQAAAYAYSWQRISNIPGVKGYMYHRHVYWPNEAGLDFGIWNSLNGYTPTEKKDIWYVYNDAETPYWRDSFDQYLPVLGFTDWSQALPAKTFFDYRFDVDSEFEQWQVVSQIEDAAVSGGFLTGKATGNDPIFQNGKVFFMPEQIDRIYIKMAVSGQSPVSQFFWGTSEQPYPTAEKVVNINVTADGQIREYILDMKAHPLWNGKEIVLIRLDPASNAPAAEFQVDYITGGTYADLNHDQKVDVEDITVMGEQWLEPGDNIRADINDDNMVDLSDFSRLALQWQ